MGPTVRTTTRPLWRVRVVRETPRYLLWGLSLVGIAASVRFAIAPPRATMANATLRPPTPPDRAAEGYATLFARRYLTWNAADPQASAAALEAFMGPGIEPGGGLQLPPGGEQNVLWAEVVQARESSRGEHVYTVAAQTDSAGLLYLTVDVKRAAGGGLAILGYPAFVGPPDALPAGTPARLREVSEPALATVVRRALRNYLGASDAELAADLTSTARVSLPGLPLSLESVQRLDWATAREAVLATVQARDRRGAVYTLAYELDVARTQGRWEVSAVQTDPDA
jgi:hypothetical protein